MADSGRAGALAARPGFCRRHLATTLALLAVAGAALAPGIPGFVDGVYAEWISPVLVGVLATGSGLLPFCLAELLLGTLLLRAAWLAVRGARSLAGGGTPAGQVLAEGCRRTLRWAAVLAAVFYWSWGLNYARAPLAELLGWQALLAPPSDRATGAAELAALARAAVDAANAAYRDSFGTDDLGVPSAWPQTAADLDRATDIAIDRAIADLGLSPAFAGRHGRTKVPLLSGLMSRLHLSGFFFPWTGEANVNDDQPGCRLPHIVAHEKAHQRGLAPEDEVELLAFAAGVRASHPYQRYSACLMAQQSLLAELARLDMATAARLRSARLPGVRRDLAGERAFWSQHQGTLSTVSLKVNDTYLRSHGVEQGVGSYSASARLLVAYARARGGLVDLR